MSRTLRFHKSNFESVHFASELSISYIKTLLFDIFKVSSLMFFTSKNVKCEIFLRMYLNAYRYLYCKNLYSNSDKARK